VKDLIKGDYTISIDKNSLKMIKGTSIKSEQKFKITGNIESDKINLKFKIKIR